MKPEIMEIGSKPSETKNVGLILSTLELLEHNRSERISPA
jgi:hypothetical protein